MATAELPAKPAFEQLKDLTECCICTEVFTDPKMLPCVHTFCLACLQEMAANTLKKPGDTMLCPICRRQFTIPVEGFVGLQRNFIVDRLVEISTTLNPLSDINRISCDSCKRRVTLNEGNCEIPSAQLYCVECRQKLCEKCSRKHKKKPETKCHRVLEFGNHMSLDELLVSLSPVVCDQHPGKKMKIYCNDCKLVVCSMCFVENHRSHNGSPISRIVDDFRTQIEKSIEKVSHNISANQEKKSQLETERAKFVKKTSIAEKRVIEISNELKELVDKHSASLLKQLATLNQQHLREIDTLLEDIDKHRTNIDSFTSYANNLKAQGSPSDICRGIQELNIRANGLLEEQNVLVARQPRPLRPSFHATELMDVVREKRMNFGKIEEHADYADNPSLVCTMRPSTSDAQGKPVWGVAILGREMFLVTDTESRIEGYDTISFVSSRRWYVDGMNDPRDIRSCPKNNCLYVFNWKSSSFKEILRICPESRDVARKWSTGSDAGRLSVSSDTRIILAVHNHNKLNEYSANGQLIREVNLDAIFGSKHPWHAIKLPTGHYVVSYGDFDDAIHGVCIVDVRGLIVRSFGGKKGTVLDVPVNLSVDTGGFIMVADHNSGRVLVLNSMLEPQRVLISKSQGLRKPIRLAADEASGRLYVADVEFDFESRKWKEGEVLVIRVK